MDRLQISLFGHVSVVHPNASAPLRLCRSTQALFAYLLLQQHLVPRDVLMDVFWMDHPPERARSNLTTALWRLRQLLEPNHVPPGTYLVAGNMGEVGFNWECEHWLDIELFERHIYPLLRKPAPELGENDVREVERVLELYRGELLEGVYADWALRERERFRSLHLNCLTRLMEYYSGKNNFEQATTLAHDILRRDPVREEIHRALMHIYLESGQRTLAIRQYIQCRDLLDKELSVAPLDETEALYQHIVTLSHHKTPSSAHITPQEILELRRELQIVKHSLVETTHQLELITQTLDRLS